MIERYTIASSQQQIEERFGVSFPDSFQPRFNAAPTQALPIITLGNAIIKQFYWGTEPHLSKNKRIASKLINAPVNQLTEKHFYKNALKSRRCLVLADGFYVWKSISKKGQVPYRVALESKSLFAMAGLWETYENMEGARLGTFALITQPAPVSIQKITADIPVILDSSNEQTWLQSTLGIEECLALLNKSSPPNFTSYAVSPFVNNLANDGANLLSPAPPADQFGNYSLFD